MHKLLLTLILHRSKPKHDHGFSLFEVTIAILVSSAFVMGTLQAMTINAVLQVKAERQAKATFLIQQDVEKLQAAASAMDLKHIEDSDVLNPAPKKSGSQLCYRFNPTKMADVRFGADFVKELDQLLYEGKDPDEIATKTTPDNDPSTKTYTEITYPTSVNPGSENKIFSASTGKATVGTKTAIVQIIRNGSDDESDPNFQNNILNKNYRLVRLITTDSTTRHDILQVYYRVGEPEDDPEKDKDGDKLRDNKPGHTSIIAENYVEVIPAAVAECGF